MRAEISFLAGCLLFAGHAAAQQSLESEYRLAGNQTVMAFEEQRQVLQTSSAVMLNGRKEIGYGIVISNDGYVLTKASEVITAADLSVTVDRTNYTGARILVVDQTWDVALVKIEASGLVPVVYAETSSVPQGTWVVSNGATSRLARRLLAGIVSAKSREIPASGGVGLGIVLKGEGETLEIAEVGDKSGAMEAGLQKGDFIVTADGKKVETSADLADVLKDRKAGNRIKITYRRKDEETTVDVLLAARAEMFHDEGNRNDQMSGDFSQRRSGFPRVMQHDILGNKSIMGGPLLDLNGKCIGMNIARANRAESFAIPVEDLKRIAAALMASPGAKP